MMKLRNIKCPCCKCNNHFAKLIKGVKGDILRWGMELTYTKWEFHRQLSSNDDYDNESHDEKTMILKHTQWYMYIHSTYIHIYIYIYEQST